MIPTIPDSDPDPTTQIPWPAARSRQAVQLPSPPASIEPSESRTPEEVTKNGPASAAKRRLTSWDLFTLSISMAGAQMAWTVELG